MHGLYILAIYRTCLNSKSPGAAKNCAGCGLAEMRVFVVEIVLSNVDDQKLPQLRQVHDLVERSLTERAFAEEANGYASVAEMFGGKGRSRGNPDAAADDCVCPEISRSRVGYMH